MFAKRKNLQNRIKNQPVAGSVFPQVLLPALPEPSLRDQALHCWKFKYFLCSYLRSVYKYKDFIFTTRALESWKAKQNLLNSCCIVWKVFMDPDLVLLLLLSIVFFDFDQVVTVYILIILGHFYLRLFISERDMLALNRLVRTGVLVGLRSHILLICQTETMVEMKEASQLTLQGLQSLRELSRVCRPSQSQA